MKTYHTVNGRQVRLVIRNLTPGMPDDGYHSATLTDVESGQRIGYGRYPNRWFSHRDNAEIVETLTDESRAEVQP